MHSNHVICPKEKMESLVDSFAISSSIPARQLCGVVIKLLCFASTHTFSGSGFAHCVFLTQQQYVRRYPSSSHCRGIQSGNVRSSGRLRSNPERSSCLLSWLLSLKISRLSMASYRQSSSSSACFCSRSIMA